MARDNDSPSSFAALWPKLPLMNPVEIDEAVSALALEPFDRGEFPFQFLRAFGNKDTAIARLKIRCFDTFRRSKHPPRLSRKQVGMAFRLP